MTWSNDAVVQHYHRSASVRSGAASIAIPVLVQVLVAMVAVVVRFAAPGWMLLIWIFGGEAVALAPLAIASVVGVLMLRKGVPRLRAAVAGVLAAMDLALLTFVLTAPDITDEPDSNFVPIVTLTQHQHRVSEHAATVFQAIAVPAVACYLISAGLVVCLGIGGWIRGRRVATVGR